MGHLTSRLLFMRNVGIFIRLQLGSREMVMSTGLFASCLWCVKPFFLLELDSLNFECRTDSACRKTLSISMIQGSSTGPTRPCRVRQRVFRKSDSEYKYSVTSRLLQFPGPAADGVPAFSGSLQESPSARCIFHGKAATDTSPELTLHSRPRGSAGPRDNSSILGTVG